MTPSMSGAAMVAGTHASGSLASTMSLRTWPTAMPQTSQRNIRKRTTA